MASEDILMVLFLNCTSTMLNFMAQMHYGNKGSAEDGILNLAAFDSLSASIFQILILYCVYSQILLGKQESMNAELNEAIEVIIAKMKRDSNEINPIGLVLAKYLPKTSVKD